VSIADRHGVLRVAGVRTLRPAASHRKRASPLHHEPKEENDAPHSACRTGHRRSRDRDAAQLRQEVDGGRAESHRDDGRSPRRSQGLSRLLPGALGRHFAPTTPGADRPGWSAKPMPAATCVAAHTASGKRAGLTEEETKEARRATSDDEKEQAALVFARKVVQDRGVRGRRRRGTTPPGRLH